MEIHNNITVFCGAKSGKLSETVFEIIVLSRLLAQNGFDLVYGGGKHGLMGKVADEFLRNQRNVIGIRCESHNEETQHPDVHQMVIHKTLSERKEHLLKMSDIILVLPGGFGTMDEMFELLAQHKKFEKKKLLVVFNAAEFYSPLQKFFQKMYECGFIKLKDLQYIHFCDSAEAVLKTCMDFKSENLQFSALSKVYLDDLRPVPEGFIGLKNYEEFCAFIVQFGIPDFISFDHDLGEGKTGYDCAKFLVEYCLDNGISKINFQVHSQNPVGKENIEKLLQNFHRYC